MTTKAQETMQDMHYLELLSHSFPTIAEASTEIINLQAILNLPKGTEHFLADIHGEFEAFQHVLKNASGNIKRKVNEIFGNQIRESEKKDLCTLIYYPREKLVLVKEKEDPTLMTKEEFFAKIERAEQQSARGEGVKMLPGEDLTAFLRRNGYDV